MKLFYKPVKTHISVYGIFFNLISEMKTFLGPSADADFLKTSLQTQSCEQKQMNLSLQKKGVVGEGKREKENLAKLQSFETTYTKIKSTKPLKSNNEIRQT